MCNCKEREEEKNTGHSYVLQYNKWVCVISPSSKKDEEEISRKKKNENGSIFICYNLPSPTNIGIARGTLSVATLVGSTFGLLDLRFSYQHITYIALERQGRC